MYVTLNGIFGISIHYSVTALNSKQVSMNISLIYSVLVNYIVYMILWFRDYGEI